MYNISFLKNVVSDDDMIMCDGAPCNVFSLFSANAHCGDCPLVSFGHKFLEYMFDGACYPHSVPTQLPKLVDNLGLDPKS